MKWLLLVTITVSSLLTNCDSRVTGQGELVLAQYRTSPVIKHPPRFKFHEIRMAPITRHDYSLHALPRLEPIRTVSSEYLTNKESVPLAERNPTLQSGSSPPPPPPPATFRPYPIIFQLCFPPYGSDSLQCRNGILKLMVQSTRLVVQEWFIELYNLRELSVDKLLRRYEFEAAVVELGNMKQRESPKEEQPSEYEAECKDMTTQLMKGLQLFHKGKTDEAIAEFEAISLSNDDNASCGAAIRALALAHEGWALHAKDHSKSGFKKLTEALQLSNNRDVSALVLGSLCALQMARPDLGDAQGNCDLAMSTIDSYRVDDHTAIHVLLMTGTVEYENGRIEVGKERVARADKLCQTFPDCDFSESIASIKERWGGSPTEDIITERSSQYSNVVVTNKEQLLPADGYTWRYPFDQANYQVEPVAWGTPSRIHPHLRWLDRLFPAFGYRWVSEHDPKNFAVEYIPFGTPSPYPNVVWSGDGKVLPEDGYAWLKEPPASSDFQVQRVSGNTPSRRYPHVVWDNDGNLHPDEGYEFVSTDGVGDFRVKFVPFGTPSPYSNVVWSGDGQLLPKDGHDWLKEPAEPGDFKVRRVPEGTPSSENPKLEWSDDGKLMPADGYAWVNQKDPDDFEVEPVPSGTASRRYINIIWAGEDKLRPADDYDWLDPGDALDFRVVLTSYASKTNGAATNDDVVPWIIAAALSCVALIAGIFYGFRLFKGNKRNRIR